ncbi:hypothetical protein [Streptomyces sp. NPDC047525]
MTTTEFPGLDEQAATGGRKRKLVLLGAVLSLAAFLVARRKR